LLDGAVGVDHDERARPQAQALDRARVTQHQLDKLGEQADPGLLLGRGVPALEHRDQPVGVAGAGRRATPVRVREQQVHGGRAELQQGLVGGERIVLHVDRAQDAAVDFAETG
jgi:hypothetical protein